MASSSLTGRMIMPRKTSFRIVLRLTFYLIAMQNQTQCGWMKFPFTELHNCICVYSFKSWDYTETHTFYMHTCITSPLSNIHIYLFLSLCTVFQKHIHILQKVIGSWVEIIIFFLSSRKNFYALYVNGSCRGVLDEIITLKNFHVNRFINDNWANSIHWRNPCVVNR